MSETTMPVDIVFLHGLGLCASSFDALRDALGPQVRCHCLDLPGFGTQHDADDISMAAMLEATIAAIAARRLANWILVGHSLGGRVATLLAARAEQGDPRLCGLGGLVLLAGSPPAPEPIEEDRRQTMLGWLDALSIAREDARRFVEQNTAAPLPASVRECAVDAVCASSPAAWRYWLEQGSREDLRAVIGRIEVPTLILAGSEDEDLGRQAQQRLNVPHFKRCELVEIEAAAHFLMLEAPAAVAGHIARHIAHCTRHFLPDETVRLIGSRRVSARTRAVLMARRLPPVFAQNTLFDAAGYVTLEALVGCILPACDDPGGLARRIEQSLLEGQGDGWRHADLPPDAQAWQSALAMLSPLATLPQTQRSAWLEQVAEGEGPDGVLCAAQLGLWFGDACALVTRTWLALPSTMARIGYDGFANGGDGLRQQGFVLTGADERESWQPLPGKGGTPELSGDAR